MTCSISFHGIDLDELNKTLAAGVDHGGNPIKPFVDEKGGWPLRCCLGDSAPGDTIAIIAWSPFDWHGPYREIGPVVVHADGCSGYHDHTRLPVALDQAPMVLRPYSTDRMIAYSHVRHVEAGRSLAAEIAEILADETIDAVHGRNITGGCYSFTASRTEG